MTKEFDAKNAEKSRRVCAAMEELANSMRRCGEVRNGCDITAKSTAKPDAVSHPSHYAGDGKIDCMTAMRAMMHGVKSLVVSRVDGVARRAEMTCIIAAWWAMSFRYLWRWPRKNGVQDLRKCRQCIDFLIEEMEDE